MQKRLFGRIYLREVTVTMLEKVCDNITGGAMGKIIKDTIHANGIDMVFIHRILKMNLFH